MAAKCPVCGAPMENGKCDYCGYVETVANEPPVQEAGPSGQTSQPQANQQQVVINNTIVNNVGANTNAVPNISRKSKWAAFFLCLFLGVIGVHRFYVGKVGTGILYLFTGGILGIGWIVDLIMILVGSFKDSYGLPLRR